MLPQHGNEDKNAGNEDQRKRDLRDEAGGEGLDVDVGAIRRVFRMPTRERGEEEEGDECENDCHDTMICQ